MFKTETHLHTKEVSLCGMVPAEEMVELYKAKGYSTIFVTDHFSKHTFSQYGDIGWNDAVDRYLDGFKIAKAKGDEIGINVLLSAELTFEGLPNDYLLYGADEKFLKSLEGVWDSDISEFYPLAKQNGITVIQAHPFRNEVCFLTPEYIDGAEVYNANPRHNNYTEKTYNAVKKHGLIITSGSDAHRLEDVARSGVVSQKEIKSVKEFIDLLKNGQLELIKDF